MYLARRWMFLRPSFPLPRSTSVPLLARARTLTPATTALDCETLATALTPPTLQLSTLRVQRCRRHYGISPKGAPTGSSCAICSTGTDHHLPHPPNRPAAAAADFHVPLHTQKRTHRRRDRGSQRIPTCWGRGPKHGAHTPKSSCLRHRVDPTHDSDKTLLSVTHTKITV